MDGTTQGLIAAGIGIVIFVMGYLKGSMVSTKRTLDTIIGMGYLAVDNEGNLVAGPKLKNK